MTFRLHPRSIAFRLILAVLAVELASSILVVALSYGYERHIHFRAFGVMLHGRADSILGAVQDAEDPGDNLILDKGDLHIPSDDVYEVWDSGSRLLGRSPNWQGAGPDEPKQPRGDFIPTTIDGRSFEVLRFQGVRTVDPGQLGGGKVHKIVVIYGSPTMRVWRSIRDAVEFYAGGSLFLLVVTGPLIAWLLHRGLLPLRQLAGLASQVSVDAWHFEPPASAYTTPELAPLTHALENVLERLERSFLQQRAFVSDAAHELKTAVAVIKSSLQLLNMKPRSAKEYQAGLERCLADSQRLEALVADMLTLARAEARAADAATKPETTAATDLAGCIAATITQLETVATLRQVQLVVSAKIPEANVPLAPEDCTILLSNLILNAIQHSSPGSAVEVSFELEGSAAVLTVRDHGEGIPADALPHVFERFYRGDPSRTRSTGGTGLGLAIAKAIVTKAGGELGIASQADEADPDHGTTVTLRLPVPAHP
jgi:signal transduction histidine kinase